MIDSRRTGRPHARRLAPRLLPNVAATLIWLTMMVVATATRAATSCFSELEQNYAWDDGGVTIRSLPKCIGDQGSAELHKIGGSTHVEASLSQERVIEEQYGWTRDTLCGPLRKTLTRTIKVQQGGIRYELRESNGKAPQRTQRPVSAGAVIPGVGGPTTVPADENPYIARLGADTIAGQPCERTMTKSAVTGAAVTTMCVFVVARSCKLAPLVQVLDLKTVVAGEALNHGRTSLLRVGGPGKVLAPGTISPP